MVGPLTRQIRGLNGRGDGVPRRGLVRRLGALARQRPFPENFDDIYNEMALTVFAYFLREVQHEQTALDLTAETFAIAWYKRDDFRGASDGEARSWIWTIAYSCESEFHRVKRVDGAALERVGWERPLATEEDLMEVEMLEITLATHQHLVAALGDLPSDQQQVLRMRFCEQPLPFEEIAARLGVSSATARKRASRGLNALRRGPHSKDIQAMRQT